MPRIRYLFRLPSKLRRRARRSRIATMLALAGIACLLLAPFYAVYKPPAVLMRYFAYRWPDVLWSVTTEEKVVALTIDDGPSEYTRDILRVLEANDAAATFFVIGAQVAGREETLRELVRNGHELGNHAMHDEPSRALSDVVLADQIQAIEGMIASIYATANTDAAPPRYFRPGSGFFNERMRRLLAGLGYRLVLGSIYPHDAQISLWRLNARHVLSMLRPGGIIICHDRRSWTVPMLERVLPEIRRRGYRIVTVTQLLEESKRA
ncbi:hypothetical protein BDY21DRAFT_394753 [Lineolata rhizophorae]|uniref:chitin deacetylase n=1 Tax=Lineolata rhizophorae TaxID=578093 RepID=A0A6A6NXK5_9PEZI|nr:hypothetical protein BDY21DRAFT_394753 [Lineolata rhizophorae]